jgi:hypothetical protein
MKFKQAPMGEGLDTYVSHKHAHPLHSLVSVIEALLMLFGVVALILFVYLGSFSRAGQVIDDMIEAGSHAISGTHTPKQ